MRRLLVLGTVPALLGLGFGAPPASARSAHCSPSGDYCKSTYKREGRRTFELRTAADHRRPDDPTNAGRAGRAGRRAAARDGHQAGGPSGSGAPGTTSK